jgi:hypothetical protein
LEEEKMRYLSLTKKAIIGAAFGVLMSGAVVSVSAQNTKAEYREWQKAQRQAQKEQRDYMRTRSPRDYRQWQEAQRRVNEEYREYQRSMNDPYYRNNDRVLGSGYYNNNANRRYRVYRNGTYYNTDSRGAELLRAAVQNGYNQGYRQGQIDNQYGRRYNYSTQSMYRSGTYGYQSYVARDQYQHYFQQGFQRGYEDGFNSTFRYGSRVGNNFNILGNVLNSILNIIDQ